MLKLKEKEWVKEVMGAALSSKMSRVCQSVKERSCKLFGLVSVP